MCRISPRATRSIRRLRASRAARSLVNRASTSVSHRYAGRRSASGCRPPSCMSRRRRCGRAWRCPSGGRRGRPRQSPHRNHVQLLQTGTAAPAACQTRLATGPPIRRGDDGRSRVPTACCQRVGTSVGICHVATVTHRPGQKLEGGSWHQEAPLYGAFLMRPRGLEPPRTLGSTRPSTLRVYQFRHRRVGGEYTPAHWGFWRAMRPPAAARRGVVPAAN